MDFRPMITNILSALNLDEEEVKIYLALLDHGENTAANVAKIIGVPRPSVYGFLKRLCEKGVVTESLRGGVKTFIAEPPEKLHLLFEQAAERIQKQHAQFLTLLPSLKERQAMRLVKPKFQLFEGEEGVRHVLKDMLLYRNIETQAFWPIKAMLEILSPDFFHYLNMRRIKQNISTRAIWPQEQMVDVKTHPYLGVGEKFKREIRIAPKDINFSMGYWLYATKAAFVSSRRESFGFIIESAELTEMLLAQFESLWRQSKPLLIDPKDVAPFLKQIV